MLHLMAQVERMGVLRTMTLLEGMGVLCTMTLLEGIRTMTLLEGMAVPHLVLHTMKLVKQVEVVQTV